MGDNYSWINNHFINKDQYAPFVVETDNEYYKDLYNRYKKFLNDAKVAGADGESLKLISSYSQKICEAIRFYYHGQVSTCHTMVKNLVGKTIRDTIAVDIIKNSDAFPGVKGEEVQFFRARENSSGLPFENVRMLHLPFNMRGKTGNYRFSIPGVPSLYLGNSSYACWLELGRPTEHDFMVSPVVVDDSIKVLNLAVKTRDIHRLDGFEKNRVHSWLMLIMLMMATSYRVKEEDRIFHSEYIISQSVMLACKRHGLDGVAYYSKRVEDEMFAFPAVNVALFAEYKNGKQYGDICDHIKIGDSYNYGLFRQLNFRPSDNNNKLRCLNIGIANKIGDYERQHDYQFTQFAEFDKFLYAGWDKDNAEFGNAVMI